MSVTVYKPVPRYVVETAETFDTPTGQRFPGAWNFAFAFYDATDARAAADRLAEEHEYVRVIDRAENEEKN